MEGAQLPPTSPVNDDDDKPDDPPSVLHRPTASLPVIPSAAITDGLSTAHARNHSLNFSPPLSLQPRPAPNPIPEVETYVVQVPRDQVYWVPPPEHAKIVERRRKTKNSQKVGCSKRFLWFFVVLFILGFILGVITLIFMFVFQPVLPVYTVEKLVVKSQKSHIVSLDIALRADNPTSNMGVQYMQGDGVSITYKNKNFGHGKFPKLSQDASGSDTVHLKLDGSKNMAVPDSKDPVKLVLAANLKAEYSVGPLKRKRKLKVMCDVKVKGLETKNVKIVSENCESQFINK